MKYLQSQADIIVDQLNYGTIGAAAREAMMLGKPVICHIAAKIYEHRLPMRDCPVINATEETIYDVLKKLILMPEKERKKIGVKSRKWMLKWYDAKVCAKRFEQIYDRLMNGKPPYSESIKH